MLILSGSTPLYVLLLCGSGTPRYRPRSGCPSGGSSSTTISTLLIAARRSAGREFSASSIASSNGSLRPGSERASISAMVPESVLGQRRLLLGGFVASRYCVTVSGQQHWPAWATEPVDLVDADPTWTVHGAQERDHLETLLAPWLIAHIESHGERRTR